MDVDIEGVDLNLVDIETKQMEDLTAMRMRPHLLPYRRFIYIGEVSFASDKKNRLAAGVSLKPVVADNTIRQTDIADRVYRSRQFCSCAQWSKLTTQFGTEHQLNVIGDIIGPCCISSGSQVPPQVRLLLCLLCPITYIFLHLSIPVTAVSLPLK